MRQTLLVRRSTTLAFANHCLGQRQCFLLAPMSSSSPAAGGSKAKSFRLPNADKAKFHDRPRRRRPRHDSALASHARRYDVAPPKPNTKSWPATSPDTVAAHWKTGRVVPRRKADDRVEQHLERILELDPNHADGPHRARLPPKRRPVDDPRRRDGRARPGLVRRPLRHAAASRAHRSGRKKSRVTQADWNNRIEQLRSWLTGRRPDKVAQARAEIQAISDPQAADAIVAVLGRENDSDLKRLWIEVASKLNIALALDALVDLSLTDPDEDIRHQCLEIPHQIGPARHCQRRTSAPSKTRQRNRQPGRQRLGQIGDRDAIGPLIDALITKHKIKVSDANPDQHAYTFSNDGGAPSASAAAGRKS